MVTPSVGSVVLVRFPFSAQRHEYPTRLLHRGLTEEEAAIVAGREDV